MVFATARKAGWLPDRRRGRARPDRQRARRRTARSCKHPQRRADPADGPARRSGASGPRAVLEQARPELDDASSAAIARQVGIGAVKYADLSVAARQRVRLRLRPDARLDRQHRALPAVRGRADPRRSSAGLSSTRPAAARTGPRRRAGRARPGRRADRLRVGGGAGRRLDARARTGCAAISSTWPRRSRRSTSTARCCNAADQATRASRLALTAATLRILARGLDLLGIAVPRADVGATVSR